jgi:4-oxalocrotonate tautomerase
MPYVAVEHLEGAFTLEQQQQLMREITNAFVKVGGEGIRPNVTVVIREIADGRWAIGGEALTMDEVRRVREERARSGS